MRRLGITLTILAVALVGSTAMATSGTAATVPLAKVTVSGAADAKPVVKFPKPFAASVSTSRVVTPGTGEPLAKGARILFDFLVIDGRTGAEIGSSFGASPIATVLDAKQSPKGLVKGLVGSAVGSRVLIALSPKEGLAANAKTNGAKNVKKDDTLLFVVDVKSIRTPLARATGDAVTPAEGLPTVTLDATGKPSITVPSSPPPTQLVVQPLIKGAGAAINSGQTVTAHYTALIWGTGKQFDSTWDRGAPSDITTTVGSVIPGLATGLVGQTIGSQVLYVIPPDQGYGTTGNTAAGIAGTDTLVFVIDILDAY